MSERGKGKNKKENKVWLDNYWSDKYMKVHLYFPYSRVCLKKFIKAVKNTQKACRLKFETINLVRFLSK